MAILRGMLVSAIYKKATEISITTLDDKAAMTLMSTDMERIVVGFRASHEIWANSIQIVGPSVFRPLDYNLLICKGIATWLLERQIGLACIAPVLVGVCTYPYPL